MATSGVEKALVSFDKLKASVKHKAELAKIEQTRVITSVTALVGAAMAGVAEAKYVNSDGSQKKIGPVPTIAGIAALASIAGLSDWIPGAEYVAAAGIGALSYQIGTYAHDETVKNMQNQQQQAA